MTQLTDLQLKQLSTVVKTETASKANTALRIGTLFENIIDSKTNNLSGNTAVTGATNLGGNGLYSSTVNHQLKFKGLVAGSNITLTPSSTGVTITSTGGGGGSTPGVSKLGNIAKTKFIIDAYAIVRLRNSFVDPGNGNFYIKYELLDVQSGHDSHFIYGAHPMNDQQVYVDYPPIKEVYYGLMIPDDTMTGYGIAMMGTGVGYINMQAYMRIPMMVSSDVIKLSTITSTPAAVGVIGGTLSVDGTGIFTYTVSPIRSGYEMQSYQIKVRMKTGVGIFNLENEAAFGTNPLKFSIRDAAGIKITSFDSANDGDFIIITSPTANVLFDARYTKGTFNFGDMGFEATYVNFWAILKAEAWMICSPVDSVSVLSEWQPYPLATDYQLYRSTSITLDTTIPQTGNITSFNGETQVYTGTGFQFTDSGLTPNTQYWYRLKGTVNGVPNTVITFFDVKTNPN